MTRRLEPSFYVVMIDYGTRGQEAVVDPTLTREDIIDRLRSGEYQNVVHITHVADGFADDCTHELIELAEQAARALETA